MTFRNVMTQVAAFTSEAMARSYRDRKQDGWIVLGDDGQYWVTSYRYAQWLVQRGYELLDA